MPVDAYVTLKIYDILGGEIAVLVDEVQPAGYRSTVWSAPNLPSGIYLCRISVNSAGENGNELFRSSKIMILIK